MPRNITVTFSDGSTHVYQNAPDNITPEQVSARASQDFGKQVASLDGGRKPVERGFFDTVKDTAANVGTHLVKGFTGLATMAGDAMADDPQVRLGVDAAEKAQGLPTGSRQPRVGELMQQVGKLGYQPKNGTEKVIAALAAGAGGGLSGPGAVLAPAKAALTGMGAAVGSELAGEATNHNPAATLIGGVLGGGVTGMAVNMRGNTQALAREALRDTKPQDLEAAKQAMLEAQKAGVPVNLSQAMPNPSNVDTIVNTLANSRYGTKVTKQLRAQPQQVEMGMEDQLLNLPGQVRAPQTVANNAQEVATQIINGAKQGRSEAWRAAFDRELGKLQDLAKGNLRAAVAKAAEAATKFKRTAQGEAALQGQIDTSAQGVLARKQAEHAAAVAAIRQRNDAAMAEHEKALANWKPDTHMEPVPAGMGSDGAQNFFELPQFGQDAAARVAARGLRNEVMPEVANGRGVIQLEDGSSAAAKYGKPQPPQQPKLESYPPAPQLEAGTFPKSAPAARQELDAANGAVGDARKALQNVGELPQDAVSAAYKRLTREAEARPNTGLGAAILELRDKLVRSASEGFITNVEQLNNILKDTTNKLKAPDLATKGLDAGDTKMLGGLVNELRDGWGAKFSPYREANATYREVTDTVVNPLKKSVVGEIAGRRGALPDADAVKTKLMGVFNAGTVPGAKSSEILALEKQFRNVKESEASVAGSAAYQDAAKTWMASKISEASRVQGGRVDPNIASRLEQTFLGNDTKAQGFKDMLVGLARSQGKPDGTYVEGVTKFLKVASMAARRPGTVQGVSEGGAAEIAGRTIANAGGSTTVNPLRNLMLRWSERLQADAYKEMDRLLTSPEGVDMLQTLAKKPALSPAAQAAISTFLGANAARIDDPVPDYEQ
jgi:hypothetical protein